MEVGLQGCCNQIHAFDFKSMCWCRSLVPPARLGHRTGHTAASHHDQIIIVGGLHFAIPCSAYQKTMYSPAFMLSCGVFDVFCCCFIRGFGDLSSA